MLNFRFLFKKLPIKYKKVFVYINKFNILKTFQIVFKYTVLYVLVVVAEHVCSISDGDCSRIVWYGNRELLIGNIFEQNNTYFHKINLWKINDNYEEAYKVGQLSFKEPINVAKWSTLNEYRYILTYESNNNRILQVKIECAKMINSLF